MNTLNPRLVPCLANSINKSVPHSSSFPRSRKSRLSCLSWTPGSYATNFRNTTGALSLQIIVWLLLTLAVPGLADSSPSGSQSAVPAATKQKLAKLQIPFISNQGQGDKEIKFYARTFSGTVFVTKTGDEDNAGQSSKFHSSVLKDSDCRLLKKISEARLAKIEERRRT